FVAPVSNRMRRGWNTPASLRFSDPVAVWTKNDTLVPYGMPTRDVSGSEPDTSRPHRGRSASRRRLRAGERPLRRAGKDRPVITAELRARGPYSLRLSG